MIPIPPFVPGQTLITTPTGYRVTNPETDPPAPLPNGGFNFNSFACGSTSGYYEDVLEAQEQYNLNMPLSVNPQGNLVIHFPGGGSGTR